MTGHEMTTEEFDDYFDAGGDITAFIDPETVRFPNRDASRSRANFNMPTWMVEGLDKAAKHYGNTRQGVLNMWIGERLEQFEREVLTA